MICDNYGIVIGWGVIRVLKLGEEYIEEDLLNFFKYVFFKI